MTSRTSTVLKVTSGVGPARSPNFSGPEEVYRTINCETRVVGSPGPQSVGCGTRAVELKQAPSAHPYRVGVRGRSGGYSKVLR